MRIHKLHPWKVTPREAREIQERLRGMIRRRGDLRTIRTVAGADCAFDARGETALAAVVVFRFPDLELIETRTATRRLDFPYIPGLLSFREAPVLLEAFSKLRTTPDLILFDGQGYAHPRRIGIAAHVGLLLDRPAIGCAKSRLIGAHREPGLRRGSRARLIDRGEVIGSVLRTRTGIRPIFVSVGHRCDLAAAVRVVLRCSDGFRIPKPTRVADRRVGDLKREIMREGLAADPTAEPRRFRRGPAGPGRISIAG